MSDNKYQRGKIYRIVCNTTGLQYYGSTIENKLCTRLAHHKAEYKRNVNKKTNHYVSSFKILENNNYEMILVENFVCNSKDELHQRERFYIENNECVNKQIPIRTKEEHKEYFDKWCEENKDLTKETKKEYYEQNKDEILVRQKEYYEQNKDEILEKCKAYKELKKDTIKEKNKEYREQNKEIIKIKQHEFCLKNKGKKREYDRLRREKKKQEQKNTPIL